MLGWSRGEVHRLRGMGVQAGGERCQWALVQGPCWATDHPCGARKSALSCIPWHPSSAADTLLQHGARAAAGLTWPGQEQGWPLSFGDRLCRCGQTQAVCLPGLYLCCLRLLPAWAVAEPTSGHGWEGLARDPGS